MAFIAFFGAGAGAAAFLAAFIAFIGGAAFLVAFIAFMASGMAKKGRKLTCELFEPKCLQTQCLWIESDSPKYKFWKSMIISLRTSEPTLCLRNLQ